MPAVGGCIRSEHGRSDHAAAAATTSAHFETRAGWPLPPRGQPAGRHGQPPARHRPHTGRPQFEPAEPAGCAASRAASRAASPRPRRAEPGGWRLGHLVSAASARVAEPLWAGGSARFRAGPDGRPARSGGWLSPIGGVAQPDLAGGSDQLGGWLSPIWPVAGRVAGGSATHQIGLRPPLTGRRFLLRCGAAAVLPPLPASPGTSRRFSRPCWYEAAGPSPAVDLAWFPIGADCSPFVCSLLALVREEGGGR